jgi:hypothetical protein
LIVNTNEFQEDVHRPWLGQPQSLRLSEVAEKIHEGGWDAAGVLAFCKALLASPDGLDPATVTALPADQRPYVVEFFESKGVVI